MDTEWWKQKYVLAKVFLKYVYLIVWQRMNQTVLHVHKNVYEIQYALHDHVYKVRTRVRRGPSNIIQILNHQGEDVTDEVRTYLGPNEDFHGQCMTPNDLGFEELSIQLRKGETMEYKLHDKIQIV